MRFRFDLRGGNLGLSVCNLGSAAVAMIDRNDLRYPVKLNRGRKVVPEGLVPVLEGGRYHADCGAGNDKLAVFSQHASAFHVIERRLGKSRIDAREYHRLVISFR